MTTVPTLVNLFLLQRTKVDWTVMLLPYRNITSFSLYISVQKLVRETHYNFLHKQFTWLIYHLLLIGEHSFFALLQCVPLSFICNPLLVSNFNACAGFKMFVYGRDCCHIPILPSCQEPIFLLRQIVSQNKDMSRLPCIWVCLCDKVLAIGI